MDWTFKLEDIHKYIPKEKMNQIKELGFFKAPASIKNHLNKEGGLVEHSINVINAMIRINKSMELGVTEEDIVITGILHDLSKVGYYEENILKSGARSEKVPYKYANIIGISHGADSMYIAINELDIKLTVPQAVAICNHMGCFDPNYKSNISTIKKTKYDMKLTWLLHSADMYCAYIEEQEG